MELISYIIGQGLTYILSVTVLLGLLIFIHELGHFLVAKWCGVKVEVFSLGFGPKIFQFVKGDTTYCLSALPLGGYVKMFGDEFNKEIPDELKAKSFLHKPVWQRIAIALAGPLMNLLFAAFIFTLIAFIGDKATSPTVGDIATNSQAHKLGFRSGDIIKSVSGTAISTWSQIMEKVSSNADKTLEFEVSRNDTFLKIGATPSLKDNANVLSRDEQIGSIDGLIPYQDLPIFAYSKNSNLPRKIGLLVGDIIVGVNGTPIETMKHLKEVLTKLSQNPAEKLELKVKRKGDLKQHDDLTLSKAISELTTDTRPELQTATVVKEFLSLLDDSEVYISSVVKDSPAEKLGLKPYDKILSIDNVPILDFEDIVTAVGSYKEKQRPLELKILRSTSTDSVNFTQMDLKITPNATELKDPTFGTVKTRYTIGIRPLKGMHSPVTIWRASSLGDGLDYGLSKTWEWTEMTVMSFVRLAQRKVSPSNLGGFISIGQMAKKSWEYGLSSFLRIMGIISINLFILNLLPIPILDGGHIVFYIIEAIKGSPLSLKKLQMAQSVGLVLILFLMVFSLFNDFARIFGS